MSVSTWILKYLVGKMKVFCEISIHLLMNYQMKNDMEYV